MSDFIMQNWILELAWIVAQIMVVIGPLLIGLGQPIEIAPLRSSTSDILNLASVAAYSASVINYGKKN